MTDSVRLELARRRLGIPLKSLAIRMKIPLVTLERKWIGSKDFTAGEIRLLCNILQLSVRERNGIFFARKTDSFSNAGSI